APGGGAARDVPRLGRHPGQPGDRLTLSLGARASPILLANALGTEIRSRGPAGVRKYSASHPPSGILPHSGNPASIGSVPHSPTRTPAPPRRRAATPAPS